MAKKTTAKKMIALDTLNIVPQCKVQKVVGEYRNAQGKVKIKTETVAVVDWTPRQIEKVMRKYKLNQAFVKYLGGTELYYITNGTFEKIF